MTIEFKKETDRSLNAVFYYTVVDGLVVGSISMKKDEAYDFFLKVVENKGLLKTVETLETKQI